MRLFDPFLDDLQLFCVIILIQSIFVYSNRCSFTVKKKNTRDPCCLRWCQKKTVFLLKWNAKSRVQKPCVCSSVVLWENDRGLTPFIANLVWWWVYELSDGGQRSLVCHCSSNASDSKSSSSFPRPHQGSVLCTVRYQNRTSRLQKKEKQCSFFSIKCVRKTVFLDVASLLESWLEVVSVMKSTLLHEFIFFCQSLEATLSSWGANLNKKSELCGLWDIIL